MVGRKIGEDRDVGRQRPGQFGLVGGQFEDHDFAAADRVEVEHAATDVAAKLGGMAGFRQDVVDQCRGGRLAVRSGDGDDAGPLVECVPRCGCDGAEEQADVIVHRDAGSPGGTDRGMGRGVEMGDAGRGHEQRNSLPALVAGQVAQAEAFGFGGNTGGFAVVPDHGRRAPGGQRTGGGPTRPAEAKNGDGLSGNTLNGNHGMLR